MVEQYEVETLKKTHVITCVEFQGWKKSKMEHFIRGETYYASTFIGLQDHLFYSDDVDFFSHEGYFGDEYSRLWFICLFTACRNIAKQLFLSCGTREVLSWSYKRLYEKKWCWEKWLVLGIEVSNNISFNNNNPHSLKTR